MSIFPLDKSYSKIEKCSNLTVKNTLEPDKDLENSTITELHFSTIIHHPKAISF